MRFPESKFDFFNCGYTTVVFKQFGKTAVERVLLAIGQRCSENTENDFDQ